MNFDDFKKFGYQLNQFIFYIMRKSICIYSNQICKSICFHPDCHIHPGICQLCPIIEGCKKLHYHGNNQIKFTDLITLRNQAKYFQQYLRFEQQLNDPYIYAGQSLLETYKFSKNQQQTEKQLTNSDLKIILDIKNENILLLTGSMIVRIYNQYLSNEKTKLYKTKIQKKYAKQKQCTDQIQKIIKKTGKIQKNKISSAKQKRNWIKLKKLNDQFFIDNGTFLGQQSTGRIIKTIIVQNEFNLIIENEIKQCNQKKPELKNEILNEYRLAVTYYQQRQFKKAEMILSQCIKKCKKYEIELYEPYYQLAKVYQELQNYQLSEYFYQQGMMMNSKPEQIYLGLEQASINYKHKSIIEYKEFLENIQNKTKLKEEVQKFLELYISNKQFQKVQQFLNFGFTKNIWNNKQRYEHLAKFYYSKASYKQAEKYYHQLKVIQLNQSNLQNIYLKLAQIYIHLKQFLTSIQYLEQAQKLNSHNIQINYFKALNYRYLNQYGKALKYINDVLLSYPEKHQYLYQKVILLNKLNRYDQALVILQKFDKNQIHIKTQLLEIYYRKHFSQQFYYIIRQFSININHNLIQISIIYNTIGNLNQTQKSFLNAIRSYTQAISYYSADAQYYENRSQCLIQLGQIQLAIEDLVVAISINECNQLKLRICFLYYELFKKQKKKQFLEKSINYIQTVIKQSIYLSNQSKQKYLEIQANLFLEIAEMENDSSIRLMQGLKRYKQAVSIKCKNGILVQKILKMRDI